MFRRWRKRSRKSAGSPFETIVFRRPYNGRFEWRGIYVARVTKAEGRGERAGTVNEAVPVPFRRISPEKEGEGEEEEIQAFFVRRDRAL